MSSGTIIVVDDEDMTRNLMASLLRKAGYTVFPARSGEECLQVLATVKPNAVLMDIKMTGLTGVEVCLRIRNSPPTQYVPVIFVTAHANRGVIEEIRHIPNTHVIAKPFLPESFLDKFRKCLLAARG